MKEKDLYAAIKRALPEPHWQRLENSVGIGQPDVNCCWQSREFWLELKIGKPLIRPAQYAWGMRRAKQGGIAWIMSRHPVDKSLSLWRYPFKAAESTGGKLTPTGDPLFRFSRNPLDWGDILKVLTDNR